MATRKQGLVTRKQRLAMEALVADSRISTAQALRQAGYATSMVRHPERVTSSLGWQELAAEYLPESTLLKTARDGLQATKLTRFKDDPDKTYEEVDYYARHQYLQTGLKIRNLVSETPLGGDVVINMTNYYDTPTPPPPTPINIEVKEIKNSKTGNPKKIEILPTP